MNRFFLSRDIEKNQSQPINTGNFYGLGLFKGSSQNKEATLFDWIMLLKIHESFKLD